MNKVIVASFRKNAGKTSVTVGITKALNKKIGYLKPFGDRLIYSKKRLWDYDSALIATVFTLHENPEDMSIGFDHSKLRYMYDEKITQEKLSELVSNMGQGKDILFIEGGRDLSYGISVYLDSLSLAKTIGGRLVIVISGDEDTICDDITYVKKQVDVCGIDFKGVIINKVQNIGEFKETSLPQINKIGVPVLGIIPFFNELTHYSINFLSERLFAKVVTGEENLNRVVKNIFIGAMSVNAALQQPHLKKEGVLMITGGDRTDMILVALDYQAAGIILTNNVLPPAHIISKAAERKVPMLMVSYDTYETARRIDNIEPLMTREDTHKIELLGRVINESVDIQAIV
jgi:hypothetical protein